MGAILWVLVATLVAFALGWWAHGWWTRPLPVPPVSAPDLPRRAEPFVDDGRVLCVLHDKAGQWVSTQTRTAGAHPATIEKPHGKQPPTVYRLQGIHNGIGQYQEIG